MGSKRPPYPELLTYLSKCLALVLEGVDANRALGLERPPGRPGQQDKWLQDDYLADQVLEDMKGSGTSSIRLAMRRVACKSRIKERAVREAWQRSEYRQDLYRCLAAQTRQAIEEEGLRKEEAVRKVARDYNFPLKIIQEACKS